MDILITYDIATADAEGERRLARVAKLCEGYGVRVQKSVFECRLSAPAQQQLMIDLADLIDVTRDAVNLYRFPGDLGAARVSLGLRPRLSPSGPWIV